MLAQADVSETKAVDAGPVNEIDFEEIYELSGTAKQSTVQSNQNNWLLSITFTVIWVDLLKICSLNYSFLKTLRWRFQDLGIFRVALLFNYQGTHRIIS